MWVKLTPDELVKANQRRKRQRIMTAFYVTVICFLIVVFVNGEWNFIPTGYFLRHQTKFTSEFQWILSAQLFLDLRIIFSRKKNHPLSV